MSKYNLPAARNRNSVKKYLRTLLCFTAIASTSPLLGTAFTVTIAGDSAGGGTGAGTAGDLRYCINQANQVGSVGSTISFTIADSITLLSSLPPISPNVSLIDSNSHSVTIDGSNLFQAFFIPQGSNIAFTGTTGNLITVQNCVSAGGNGGAGGLGGGGALGAGGGLLVAGNSNVTIGGVTFNNCKAIGGNGGGSAVPSVGGAGGGGMNGGTGGSSNAATIQGGGGGGGYGSPGGAGGTVVGSSSSGGGGGGGLFFAGGNAALGGGGGGSDLAVGNAASGQNGGSGGAGSSGLPGLGGAGGAAGGDGGVGTLTSGGGGGGYSTANNPGGAGGQSGGASFINGGGGGGGGSAGGDGGSGGNVNGSFGGGGGGGGTTLVSATGGAGGSLGGFYGGGGGGGGNGTAGGKGGLGGHGGLLGGGGGAAGANAVDPGNGGNGGFGGGGGGGYTNPSSGQGGFGGGNGGGIITPVGGGGGGALGGTIFIESPSTLIIKGPLPVSATGFNPGVSQAGAGGSPFAQSGQALGPDIFIMSGANLEFQQTTAFTINTAIASDGSFNTFGGLRMNGPGGTLTLGGNNTYTSATTITAGTLSISSDSNLGNTLNPITFNGTTGTLQVTATTTLSASRVINLNGTGRIQATTLTVPGLIQGTGGMLVINGGIFIPTNPNNTYARGTSLQPGATVQISTPGNLGAVTTLNPLEFHAGTSGATLELLPAFGNATFSNPITMSGFNPASAVIQQDVGSTALHSTFSGTVALNGDLTISQTGAAAATSTLTFSGVISGAGAAASLTQSGIGILRLTNTGNTYAGGTNFNGGTVEVFAPGNLGPGTLTFNGGTLEISGPFQGSQTMLFNAPGGTVEVDNGITGILSGSSSGAGGLTKTGPGVLALKGANTYTGPTTIMGGTLVVDGSVTSPILVDFGATLMGTGTVGNVNNLGIIAPGDNAIGTIHGSNFTFNPGSSYYLELNNSTSDLIAATTSVAINGGTLRLFPINFTTPTVTSYTIITAPVVTVTVPFVLVNPLPRFMFTVVYEPTDVRLTLNQAPIPFRTIVPFGNAGAVAKCFDVLVDENPSDLNDVIAIINLQTASQIEHSLNQMQPSNFNNIYLAEENVAERIRQLYTDHFFEQRVINCPDTDAWRIWAAPFVERTRQHGSGKHPGYLERFSGFSLATDYQFERHWMITGGFSYAGTEMSVPGARTNAHFKTYAGTIGAAWTDSHFFADALFSYLYSPVEARRKMVFAVDNFVETTETTRTAKHHDHSNQVLGHLGGGYDFRIKASEHSSVNIYPFVNLDYIYIPQDGYTEHGAGSLDLKVKSKQYDVLRPEGGFGIGYKGCFEFVETMLDLSVSYVGEFRFSGKKTSARFEPASCTFSVTGLKPQNNLISPSARLRITSPVNGYSLTLGYHGEYGSHFIQNTGEAELRKAF